MSELDAVRQNVSQEAASNIEKWLVESKYAEYKDELVALIHNEDWQVLEDSFFKVIEFGTAGRRGSTGIGSNRINRVTIGESAQALCIYAGLADKNAPSKGVVIACDTRLSSPELSQYAARVCAANGFKTYLFDNFRSTPELSFAVRELGAAIGIVISASHNPPIDNGFKAYWSDGGQLTSPHDKGVLDVAADISNIHSIDFSEAISEGKIEIIGSEIDKAYLQAVVSETEGDARDIDIVYSPLHGAGQTNTLPALQLAGFKNISLVADQMVPDGNFPTITNGKPNPEEKEANDRAVAQMLEQRADITITNDPDADRIGVMVRQDTDVIYLTGNEAAVLAVDYALKKMQMNGTLSPQHYVVKTIVTTDMIGALADHHGVKMYGNLLIGFKYIASLILSKENTDEIFVMGAEESFGLLKGDYVRDKDGAVGALPIAEYAAELKQEGKTLFDMLLELYARHGLYLEHLDSAYFMGSSGFDTMQRVMAQLRQQPPERLGDHAITAILDYKNLERRNLEDGAISPIDCVQGNIIVFEFDNDTRRRITIRPSGTEPKIKFYVQWYEDVVVTDIDTIRKQRNELKSHLEYLSKLLEGIVLH